MNKKEISEIKKQFTPDNCAITRICGCYVDGEKNKKTKLKEAFLSLSEEEMFRPELDEVQDEGLQIDIEDGVYVVTGKSLRRIMYSVNFDDMESLQYFQKAMESQGVFDRLREMGIEDGDTVRIYEIEFEFYN